MRKGWLLVGVVLVWWWSRGGEGVAHPHRVQAATLADGFAMLVDGDVVALDTRGHVTHRTRLQHRGDVRFVGTRGGPAIGWKDDTKVKLAWIDTDGALRDVSTWGRKVVMLCDNAASNEHRFGVGWLESDNSLWFVHGPVQRTALPSDIKPSWCGIAAAEENIALLWREGQRLLMNFCTRKQCSGLTVKVPIDPKETVLGYGCVRDACLFATRDKHGTAKLHRVNERGREVVNTLDAAARDTAVAVVGAGRSAFALSFVAKDGRATIQRVTTELAFAEVWHFPTDRAPSLAWNAGKLLVADQSGKAYVLQLPQSFARSSR